MACALPALFFTLEIKGALVASKWQGEPKCWRVRGKSTDGSIVTLGRHDTEKGAQADAEKLVRDGFYSDVAIEPIIKPPEDPPTPDA